MCVKLDLYVLNKTLNPHREQNKQQELKENQGLNTQNKPIVEMSNMCNWYSNNE